VLGSWRRSCLVILVVAVLSAGCMGSEARDGEIGWTRQQAESITVVRGMSVRVRHCRGLGSPVEQAEREYRSFRCLAGARARFDPYGIDTVAILYVLHPVAPYASPSSGHRLSHVRFIGGPGIP
jgi:hypothetical protein